MGRGRSGLGSEPDFLTAEAEQVHVIGGEDELTPLGDRRALLESVLGEGERLAVDRLVGASLDDLLADYDARDVNLAFGLVGLDACGDRLIRVGAGVIGVHGVGVEAQEALVEGSDDFRLGNGREIVGHLLLGDELERALQHAAVVGAEENHELGDFTGLLGSVKNRSELGSNVLKLSGFGDNLDESDLGGGSGVFHDAE